MAEFDAEFQRYLDFIEGVMPEQRTQRDPAKLQAEQDFLQDYFGATDYAAQ